MKALKLPLRFPDSIVNFGTTLFSILMIAQKPTSVSGCSSIRLRYRITIFPTTIDGLVKMVLYVLNIICTTEVRWQTWCSVLVVASSGVFLDGMRGQPTNLTSMDLVRTIVQLPNRLIHWKIEGKWIFPIQRFN